MYLNLKRIVSDFLFFKKRILSIVVLGHCYKPRIRIMLIIGGNSQPPPRAPQILDVDVPRAEENVIMVCHYKT